MKSLDFIICIYISLSLNFLLGYAGWRFSIRVHPEDDFAARIACAIVVCWGVLAAAAFTLGGGRVLTGGTLMVSVAGCSCHFFTGAAYDLRHLIAGRLKRRVTGGSGAGHWLGPSC